MPLTLCHPARKTSDSQDHSGSQVEATPVGDYAKRQLYISTPNPALDPPDKPEELRADGDP